MKIIIIKKKIKKSERKESFLAVVEKAAQPAGSSCVTRSVPLQLVRGTSKPSGGCVVLGGGLPVGGPQGPTREPAENNPEMKATPRGFRPLRAQRQLACAWAPSSAEVLNPPMRLDPMWGITGSREAQTFCLPLVLRFIHFLFFFFVLTTSM